MENMEENSEKIGKIRKNLRTFKTLSDFVDIEFRMETTAILST
jgi:hypothetical protein